MRPGTLLVVALLAAALAGCTGTGQEGTGITAKEAAARAEARAREWNPEAQLMHLGAWETRNSSALVQQDVGFALPSDSNVGDGRALVWFTRFGLPGEALRENSEEESEPPRTLRLIVFANGTILADEEDGSHDGEQAVHRWEVDSPRVIELARGAESVRSILDAPDGEVAVFLGGADNEASDPLWGFLAFSQSVGLMAQGAVGARSGDLLTVRTVNLSEVFPGGIPGAGSRPPLEYQFEGTVSMDEREAMHPFEVDASRSLVRVVLDYQECCTSLGRAHATILDPEGNEMPASPGGDGTYFPPMPGTYTVVVTYDQRGPVPPTPVSLGPLSQVHYQVSVTVM